MRRARHRAAGVPRTQNREGVQVARSTIGLDIGTSGVRAAEVTFTQDGPVLERCGQVPLRRGAVRDGEVADVEAVASAMRRLWSEVGFRSRRVQLGVASQRVIVRAVDLPKMPSAELRLALPFQVQDVLPMPVEQATMDFHPVEERTTGGVTVVHGLLVAVPTASVMAHVESARRAGLRPAGVDLVPFALLRSVGDVVGTASTAEALVDVGARVTNVVVHSGGAPRFVRVLLGGARDLVDELVQRAGEDSEAAEHLVRTIDVRGAAPDVAPEVDAALSRVASRLVDDIRGSLDYYSSTARDPLGGIALSGGTALVPGFADLLSDALRLPVRRADATSRLTVSHRRQAARPTDVALAPPLTAVPVGLALGGAA